MPLTGQSKVDYQRAYKRRSRSNAKPVRPSNNVRPVEPSNGCMSIDTLVKMDASCGDKLSHGIEKPWTGELTKARQLGMGGLR